MISSGALDIVVVDSVSALVPRAEIEGDMGDSHMALQARLMSQALRKLTGVVSRTKTTLIFINQLRSKIGVVYGNPETTTGGNALKFYASVRMDIRRIAPIKDGNAIIGNRAKVKIVKNKVAPPFKETELTIMFGRGVDKMRDIFDVAVAHGIIKKAGAWFYFGDSRFQGAENVIAAMQGDEIFYQLVKSSVYSFLETHNLIAINSSDSTVSSEEDTPIE